MSCGRPNLDTIRLIAFDLDGTLLNQHHTVTPRTISAIRTLSHRFPHIRVVLASGRPHEAVVPIAQKLNLTNEHIVSFNGAMLQETMFGPIILHRSVEHKFVDLIMKYCSDHALHLNVYPNGVWHVRQDSSFTARYRKQSGLTPVINPDIFELLRSTRERSTKLLIIAEPERIQQVQVEISRQFGQELYITITEREFLEIMPRDVNKGEALRLLQNKWSISEAETIAFGDGLNDIALLEAAGIRVAMQNAHKDLFRIAEIVAPHHTQDGVAQQLEQWMDLKWDDRVSEHIPITNC